MKIVLSTRFCCFLIVATTLSLILPNSYGLDASMFSESSHENVAQTVPRTVGVDDSIFLRTMLPLPIWGRGQPRLPSDFQKTLPVKEDRVSQGHSSPLPIVQQWNTTWTKNVTDGSYGVAVDSNDNIVIAGMTGNMTYPSQEIDAFVAKYSSSGTLLWDTIWNKSSTDWAYGVAVDSQDNVIITGGAANMTTPVQTFVVKYSGSGVLLWEAIGAGFDLDFGIGVAVDSNDNIAITGVAANMTFQEPHALVAKYSSSGNLLWSTFWNNSAIDYGYGVAVDSQDNIAITGITGNWTYPSWETNVFVAKYSGSGTLVWDIVGGINVADLGLGIAVDSDDNIAITGITGNMTYPTQETSAFVAKFSGSGTLLWGTTWNRNVTDYGLGVAVDSHDNIVITGVTGNLTYPSQEAEAFVAKYSYVLTVSVYTDKTVYSAGQAMILGLDVANWGDASWNVGFALWVVLPDDSSYVYMYVPSITLPAGLDYSDPSFETFVLPNISPGVYTWHVALLDPTTHAILNEDTAEWQFV